MTRIRKAARFRANPDALLMARRAMVHHGGVFTVEPSAIFGRKAPLEVEIGAAKGDFIIGRAQANPERNFLAVEIAGSVCQMLAMRCSGFANVRVARMDARTLVNLLLPDHSVTAFHVYFPDPWPKRRHAKHRLFNPIFVRGLGRTLERGGQLCVATDVVERAREIFEMLAEGGFTRLQDCAPGADTSAFGRKYLRQGRPVFAATFGAATGPDRPRCVECAGMAQSRSGAESDRRACLKTT